MRGLSAQSNISPPECKSDDLMTEPDVTETDITAVSDASELLPPRTYETLTVLVPV